MSVEYDPVAARLLMICAAWVKKESILNEAGRIRHKDS